MKCDDEERFPLDLLTRSASDRLKYLEGYSVAHTVLDVSFKKIMRTIRFPAGIQLVFVIGPPRAGKTHLMEWVMDEVQYMWTQEQHIDRGQIPVVGIEVPSKDRINPSCAEIYYRLLLAMAEPLIDKKITFADVTIYRDNNEALRFGSKAAITTTKYRYALESAIKHRQPIFIALDEAQHLLDIAGLGLEDIMDWLKSMANMTRVLLILFGTYDMYSLLDLSDQLMSRSRIIHLRRYKQEGDDLTNFQATIQAFQRNMPFPDEPSLLEHWEYLYERSVGCVGNLRNWLLAAYAQALSDEQKMLSLRHLQLCVPLSLKRATKMDANISEKERDLFEQIGEEEIINESDLTDSQEREMNEPESTGCEFSYEKFIVEKTRPKRTRVGRRNPVRDKTRQKKNIA